MGVLALKRLMSVQREHKFRRRQIQARTDRSIASVAKRKSSSCQQDHNSQGRKGMRYSGPDLPEDIWRHIHSLLPLRDAARVACVSHAFLRSWRCHPNLTFSKEALGLKANARQKGGTGRDLTIKVDHILKKHSGIGVKTFKLVFRHFYDRIDACYLNSWLQIAATPGIEELTLILFSENKADCYNVPFSIFGDGSGNSIRYLHLDCCAFRPTAGLGCLRRLYLSLVHSTGDELGCLLSNSPSLEHFTLRSCSEITYLKIPGLLQHLSYLRVSECRRLQMIESKAPNLSTFDFDGALFQLSFGDSIQVKNIRIWCFVQCNTIYNALAKLPSAVPNLETLSICSASEVVKTPLVPVKFLHLKYLSIDLQVGEGAFSPVYDYFSLVSFLDACPVLETFSLVVSQTRMKHDSVFRDPSHLRQMPEYRHDNIKNVKIIGFCSAKSMVELTCHILENATSLECLTLDTIRDEWDNIDRHVHKIGECSRIGRRMIMEARKALLAIERYIVGKVPSTVKLNVLEPCSRCHAFVA